MTRRMRRVVFGSVVCLNLWAAYTNVAAALHAHRLYLLWLVSLNVAAVIFIVAVNLDLLMRHRARLPGTYTNPVLAWRMWRIVHGELLSLNFYNRWPKLTRMEASCLHGLCGFNHGIPRAGCSCGIYALSHISRARMAMLRTSPKIAWGAVFLWGNITEGSMGYRAEFAYPARLFTTVWTKGLEFTELQIIAANYGIECVRLGLMRSILFSIGGTLCISAKQSRAIESNLWSRLSLNLNQPQSRNL